MRRTSSITEQANKNDQYSFIIPDPDYQESILARFSKIQAGRDKRSVQRVLQGIGKARVHLTFPAIPPEKAIGMYLQSKNNARIRTPFPQFKEQFNTTPGICRIVSYRELREAQRRLVKNRAQAVDRKMVMKYQWQQLAKKEEEFRKAFVKFHSFVKENEEKRLRSHQRIEYFSELIEYREKEIEQLTEQYKYLTDIKSLMEKMTKEYSMYDNFLNNTANVSNGQFRSADDFIIRYEALMEAKNLIKQKHENSNKLLEDTLVKTRRQHESAMLKLIGLRNEANTLYERCDQAMFKSRKWEGVVALIMEYTSGVKEKTIRTKNSCWSVYNAVVKRKNLKEAFEEDDTKSQLISIKKALEDAKFIITILTAAAKGSHVL